MRSVGCRSPSDVSEHGLRHVTVRLVAENGPRRGVDSRCSITANLVDGRQLFVEATALAFRRYHAGGGTA